MLILVYERADGVSGTRAERHVVCVGGRGWGRGGDRLPRVPASGHKQTETIQSVRHERQVPAFGSRIMELAWSAHTSTVHTHAHGLTPSSGPETTHTQMGQTSTRRDGWGGEGVVP